MRKIGFNYRKWKLKRRLSFGFYFVLMIVVLTIITAVISSLLGDAINNFLDKDIRVVIGYHNDNNKYFNDFNYIWI